MGGCTCISERWFQLLSSNMLHRVVQCLDCGHPVSVLFLPCAILVVSGKRFWTRSKQLHTGKRGHASTSTACWVPSLRPIHSAESVPLSLCTVCPFYDFPPVCLPGCLPVCGGWFCSPQVHNGSICLLFNAMFYYCLTKWFWLSTVTGDNVHNVSKPWT